jgi:hypothetical protein
MSRAGRWISLLPILALVPRLGLSVIAADRQEVSPETRALLLWWSSAALAVLVGLAEIYVGTTVVSRRHKGLAFVWAWSAGLGVLSTLCVCGCLWADVLRDGSFARPVALFDDAT